MFERWDAKTPAEEAEIMPQRQSGNNAFCESGDSTWRSLFLSAALTGFGNLYRLTSGDRIHKTPSAHQMKSPTCRISKLMCPQVCMKKGKLWPLHPDSLSMAFVLRQSQKKGKGEHADSEITGRVTQLIASAVLCSEYHVKWAYECLEDSF